MNQVDLQKRVKDAFGAISSRTNEKPAIGIILGTGLGDLAHHYRTN